MSAEVIDAFEGTVTIEITGALTPEELREVHRESATALSGWGGGKLLILAEAFEGWAGDADWSDLEFQTANDALVQKLAIVGDGKWESLALMFTAKGLRPFPIEYFPSGHDNAARAWLRD
jgi:hypothetical protein